MRKTTKRNIGLWLPVGAWMGVMFWLSAQSSLPDVPGLSSISSGDKFCHAIAYAIGGALVWRALEKKLAWQRIALTLALTAVYGVSDEVHQQFVANRSPDVFDWMSDVSGSALAAVVLTLITGGFNYDGRTEGRTILRSEGQEAD